jgi:hypothetical protein
MENYTDSDYDSELEDMLDSDYYPSESDEESDMSDDDSVSSESDLDSEDGYIEDWNILEQKFEARRKIFEELFEVNEGLALPNYTDFEIDVDMPSPKKDLKRKRDDDDQDHQDKENKKAT